MWTQLHLPQTGRAPPPVFGSYLWLPNGCMSAWIKMPLCSPSEIVLDDDRAPAPKKGPEPRPSRISAHVYWPRPHCARWGLSSPLQKGAAAPIFGLFLLWPNCWMHNMPLGMEVGLSPRHIVLDGDPDALPRKGHSPQFSA